jgi:anti-sigma-K factor RskA
MFRRLIPFLVMPLLLIACSKKLTTGSNGRDEVTRVMVGGQEVVDARHGKEIWLATGPLSGTGAVRANGVVVGHVFEDGASTFTVSLNAYTAPSDQQYVAWLMKPDRTEQVNMGYLTSPTSDARHQLAFMADRDFQTFTRVEVTLEQKGASARAGALQAVGILKERERK